MDESIENMSLGDRECYEINKHCLYLVSKLMNTKEKRLKLKPKYQELKLWSDSQIDTFINDGDVIKFFHSSNAEWLKDDSFKVSWAVYDSKTI